MRQRLRDIVNIFVIAPRPAQMGDHWREISALIEMADASDVTGVLIFTGNDIPIEPFVLAQTILERSTTLSPLVAVNPIYHHPYSVARMVSSFHALYGRQTYLNLVTGASVRHLESLGDRLGHDERYDRLTEFAQVVRSLLRTRGVTTFEGRFYKLLGAQLAQRLPGSAEPTFLIAGESAASRRCAAEIAAIRISMLGGPSPETGPAEAGVHFGLVARSDETAAIDAAQHIFADNGQGAELHEVALQFSDSEWKHRLDRQARSEPSSASRWMIPFRTGRADCPYVVGDHARVAGAIAGLVKEGRTTFILDVPPTAADFENLKVVLDRAAELLELRENAG